MEKQCKNCKTNFEIQDNDLEFYKNICPIFDDKKYEIILPDMCSDCRMQRRMMFRNFFSLYHRKCDISGKTILSTYDENAVFPVYDMHEWWSDKWSGLDFGQNIDFSKSVFNQMKELFNKVPHMNIMNRQCENTDYCNMSNQSKNCYLVTGNVGNEDCYYGHIIWYSKDCYDCLYTYRSELCYQCVDCVQCYDTAFSINTENCSSSRFLVNCTNCQNCFACVGLHGKKNCIFNKQYSCEEYNLKIKEYDLGDINVVNDFEKKKVKALILQEIVKYYHGFNCENCTGDYLYNCKNSLDSYDAKNCEDVRYCATTESFINCYDCNYSGNKCEFSYNSLTVEGYGLFMCHNVLNASSFVIYSYDCYGCKNCFGCIGLKNQEYCIFNKKYSKEEYEKLTAKLITQMIESEEWGEYFPIDMSPFAYNESVANTYFPLSKEEILSKGWKWKDQKDEIKKPDKENKPPENIRDASADLCKQIFTCEITGRPFKIISQELAFYKKMNISIPTKCFEQRHKERIHLKNPRKLWDRKCAKCGMDIKTTYSTQRPETVYCEKCYLEAVM